MENPRVLVVLMCRKTVSFHFDFRSRDDEPPLPLPVELLDDFFFIICNLLSTGIVELLVLDVKRDPELDPMDFDGILFNPEMLDLDDI